MCGSGTFLIEAALIAANINPGIYRKDFAFERWPDFDRDLFDRLYNDDSNERDVTCKIYGADISPKAIEIARANIKSAGVAKYIELERRAIASWTEAPKYAGVLITNPLRRAHIGSRYGCSLPDHRFKTQARVCGLPRMGARLSRRSTLPR